MFGITKATSLCLWPSASVCSHLVEATACCSGSRGCLALPSTAPRAQRLGQDGYSLAPALDLAAGSPVAPEMSWAPDLTGWDYLYQ